MSALPAIDETGARRPSRCPACQARTSAGQQWCSLCHADLSPLTPATPGAVPAAAGAQGGGEHPEPSGAADLGTSAPPAGADPGTGAGSSTADVTPGDPIVAPGRSPAVDEAVLAAMPEVDHLMAELAAAERGARIQVSGSLGGRLAELTNTPLRRAVTAFALGFAVLVCLVFGSVLLGWVL